MTDTTDPTTAPTPAPVKPGWKTTEYWLTKAAMILGALLASGILGDGSTAQRVAGAVVALLAQLGYTTSRTLVKAAAFLLIFVFATQTLACGPKTVLAEQSLIDCAKQDIGATVTEVGLTILGVVAQIIEAGADNWQTSLDNLGVEYGKDALACAVKAVDTVLNATASQTTTFSLVSQRAQTYLTARHVRFK